MTCAPLATIGRAALLAKEPTGRPVAADARG